MKKIRSICLLLLLTLMLIPAVKADNVVTIYNNEKTLKEQQYFQVEDNLNITGKYDGTVFFAGSSVTVDGTINGNAFVAGKDVIINGLAEYGFLAGAQLNIKGSFENDLFIAGQYVNLKEGSMILRDCYIAAEKVNISSQIGRNLKIFSDNIYLSHTIINGNVSVSADEINFGEGVEIKGTLKYNSDAEISGIENANISTILTYHNVEKVTTSDGIMKEEIVSFFASLLGLLFVGIILYLVAPVLFEELKQKTANYNFTKGLTDGCYGFLALIGVPIALLILLVTIIGIPISILGFIAYAICLYLSTILVGYLLGNLIWTKLFKAKNNDYLAIMIGIIAIKLLEVVPLIKGLISFVVICLGLGLMAKMMFEKKPKVIVKEEQPVKKRATKTAKEIKSK